MQGTSGAPGEAARRSRGKGWKSTSHSSPLPPARFEATLDAARRGDRAAWESIYRGLVPSLRGYAAARGAPEPDDLVAEVFLQVVRDVGRFTGDERAFRSWVFSIAHNRLVDDRRRRGNRPRPVPDSVVARGATTGDVEAEAVSVLVVEGIRRVLGSLSADQQDVLLLRIVGGLTLDEIAQLLGKRANAVKALQRRGVAALRKALASAQKT